MISLFDSSNELSNGRFLGLCVYLWGAGLFDALSGKIYNWWTFPFMAMALTWVSWNGDFADALLAGTLLSVPSYCLYLYTKGRAVGGGDLKLLLTTGLWGGSLTGISLTIFSLCLAALRGTTLALWRRRALQNVELRLGVDFAISGFIFLLLRS
ncbi:MAG: hypothetical protein MK135_03235 [Polyangiaceae bacterium]|nr:hypothetical protein [Polyangiaceae bacterium]